MPHVITEGAANCSSPPTAIEVSQVVQSTARATRQSEFLAGAE